MDTTSEIERVVYKKYQDSFIHFLKTYDIKDVLLVFGVECFGFNFLITGCVIFAVLCSRCSFLVSFFAITLSFVIVSLFCGFYIYKALVRTKKYINERADFLFELQDLLPKVFSIEDDLKESRYKYFIVCFIERFRWNGCDLQNEIVRLTALHSKKPQWDVNFYLRQEQEVFKSFDVETLKKLELDALNTGVFQLLEKYENFYYDGDGFFKPIERVQS